MPLPPPLSNNPGSRQKKPFTDVLEKSKKLRLSSKKQGQAPASEASSSEEELVIKNNESDVEISFEAYNMSEFDYHSVSTFLTSFFGINKANVASKKVSSQQLINVHALTELLTEDLADWLGTTIKQVEDGEHGDAFAIATLLPLHVAKMTTSLTSKWSKVVSQINRFLGIKCTVNKTEKEGKKPSLSSLTLTSTTALLINERMINMPGNIAGPLLKQLLDDWEEAVKDDSQLWTFQQVLIVTPVYIEIQSTIREESGENGAIEDAGESTKFVSQASANLNFYYEEYELLEELIKRSNQIIPSWTFEVPTVHDTADSRRLFGSVGSKPAKRAFLIEWSLFKEWIALVNK